MIAVARRHPILVPVIVLIIGLATTLAAAYGVHRLTKANLATQFESYVIRAEAAIEERISTYVALLEGVTGLFAASEDVSRDDFREYVRRLRLPSRYPGIQGVGWTVRMDPGEVEAFEGVQRAQGLPEFRVWPDTPRDEFHAIAFIEPMDRRNRAALGYDMFSEEIRREAMVRARNSGLPAASGRVELVQEIDEDKQAGFLIYVPAYAGGSVPAALSARQGRLLGYAYSPFRADDLFRSVAVALEDVPLEYEVYVGPPSEERLLHRSWTGDAPGLDTVWRAERPMEVAGQPWTIVYMAVPGFAAERDTGLVPVVLGAGFLATLVIAALTFAVARAWRESFREGALRRTAEAQRTLALRELNHRVKNTFATILAITRQTARTTEDKEAFVEVLTSRLTALSKTHSLLTETNWTGASMRRILESELQPYGCLEQGRCSMSGVDVELNARVSLALAMVFHELATNAAKYGALSGPEGRIDIGWTAARDAERGTVLRFEWVESGGPAVAPPSRRGFGSRLIEGSINHQLEGEVEMDHASTGLVCRFTAVIVPPSEARSNAEEVEAPEERWMTDAERRATA